MSFITQHFLIPLSPVIAIATTGVGLIALECFPRLRAKQVKTMVALLGCLLSLAFIAWLWNSPQLGIAGKYFGDTAWLSEFSHSYKLDSVALGFYGAIASFTFLALIFLSGHFEHNEDRNEIAALTLFIASGMMLLVSANSLLMIFLGLELLSLPTYVLVGVQRRDRYACEAALKYFLFGSFATVLLVFGVALLYAHFGTMELTRIADALKASSKGQDLVLVYSGLALFLIAITFKIGAAPFHMWVPDTYQGAPTPVTAFMGSAVKLAGFGLAVRLLWGTFLPLAETWVSILNILAIATVFVGNLAALVQDNLKRMFAYSSVSHAGYLLLGVTALTDAGPAAQPVYYYLVVYGLMFLGLFAVLALVERQAKSTDIHHLSGLGFSHPVLGGCLALFALSAAGIPPTAGFFGKYFLFLEAVRAGHSLLVVLAVISSVIGAYYYLRVLVFLYMKESRNPLAIKSPTDLYYLGILACAFCLILFAVFPSFLNLPN